MELPVASTHIIVYWLLTCPFIDIGDFFFRYPRLHTQEEASLLDKEQARRIGNLPCAALDYRNSSLGTSLPMDASLSKCKRDLLAIERKVPVDSLIDSWATQIWQEKVNRADSIETVKKVLAEFEQAFIGFVAAQFSTDRVFVPAAWKPTGDPILSSLRKYDRYQEWLATRNYSLTYAQQISSKLWECKSESFD